MSEINYMSENSLKIFPTGTRRRGEGGMAVSHRSADPAEVTLKAVVVLGRSKVSLWVTASV